LPAERAAKAYANIIYYADNVISGGSGIEKLGSVGMEMFIHRND